MHVLVLVEGQSEERFIKRILCPRFDALGLYFKPTVVETRKIISGGGFRGGIANFAQFRRHLVRLLGSAAGKADFVVTTMLDYYQLPGDFPGMNSRPNGTAIQRVTHVEDEIHQAFGAPQNLVPYLSLHEFEALLFVRDDAIPAVMEEHAKAAAMRAIVQECGEPELINERPGFGPSARLREIFPAYQKLLHSSLAAPRIDLDDMRTECGHFNAWLEELEKRAGLRPA